MIKNDELPPIAEFEIKKSESEETPKDSIQKKRNSSTSTRQRDLIELLKENLTSELYHAVLDVYHSPRYIIKLYLFLFILISFGLASYTTIKLMLSYFDYEVTTTTRTISETTIDFPKITICNLNPFTTQYGLSILKQVNQMIYPEIDLFDNNQTQSLDMNTKMFYFNNLYLVSMGVVSNFSDSKKKLISHQLDDILLNCAYSQELCTTAEFSWYFDAFYGNCYSYNTGINSTGSSVPLKQSFTASSFYGLDLILYVNYYEELALFNSANAGSGVLVRVDNVSHVVDHMIDGIQVASGQNMFISLSREFRTSLPKPYSLCDLEPQNPYFNSDLYNLITKSKYDYTQSFCVQQCFQNLAIQKCNCTFSLIVSLYDSLACMDPTCVWDIYSNIFIKNSFIQVACLPRCPLECNATKLTYATTSSSIIGDIYVDAIKSNSNISADFINRPIDSAIAKESIVQLNIFYDSLAYKNFEETPQWDIFSLVANLGGNLGLFLGVSFFSLCEIIATVIEIHFWKREKKKIFNLE